MCFHCWCPTHVRTSPWKLLKAFDYDLRLCSLLKMKKYCSFPGQLPHDFVLELNYAFWGTKGKWSRDCPGARVFRPTEGLWEQTNPSLLGVLSPALVMSPALDNPFQPPSQPTCPQAALGLTCCSLHVTLSLAEAQRSWPAASHHLLSQSWVIPKKIA